MRASPSAGLGAAEEELVHGVDPIKLHAPSNSTQKLKLMERGGQFTYIPTFPPRGGSLRPPP